MSSVCSIELDGISNACTINVIMNSPVTSTEASDARNSTVLSRGFSCRSFFATVSFSFVSVRKLIHQPERPVPSRNMEDVSEGINEVAELLSRGAYTSLVVVSAANGPIYNQRSSNDVLTRHKSPIAAIKTLIPIVAHDEVLARAHDQLSVPDILLQVCKPAAFLALHDVILLRKIVAVNIT